MPVFGTQYRGVFWTLSNMYDRSLCKNSWSLNIAYYFVKRVVLEMFDWVLNTPMQSIFKIRDMWIIFLTHALKTVFLI